MMSSRKKSLYKRVFQFLHDDLFIVPERFTSDYEQAMRCAAQEVWPNIKMSGCTFHYRQAVWRKYTKNVVAPLTQLSKRKHFLIRLMIYNLQMLPPHMMFDGMDAIRSVQRRKGMLGAFRVMNDYMLNFWLSKVLPENFSMYRIEHRTNNFNESLNSRMNKGMCKHPNCYEFLVFMRKVMINENHRINRQETYRQQSKMEEGLAKAWKDLDTGVKSIEQFLKTKFT